MVKTDSNTTTFYTSYNGSDTSTYYNVISSVDYSVTKRKVKKFKPMVKHIKEIDWDKIKAKEDDLFYIESRSQGRWKFKKGCGMGKEGLEKAKRSIARLSPGYKQTRYFRLCQVNTQTKRPICHVRRKH